MDMRNVYNIPITAISVGEFIDLLSERGVIKTSIQEGKKEEKRYAYGLKGLADTLGCSRGTASKIKNSGSLDEAISQIGRKIVVDVDLAIKLFKSEKK